MRQKIVFFLCIIFTIFFLYTGVQADKPNYDWGIEAIEITLDIGENIEDTMYTYEQFKYLKHAVLEYMKPISNAEKRRDFSNKFITKVAIGIAEQDVQYLNEALLFLQITMNNYGEVYYINK